MNGFSNFDNFFHKYALLFQTLLVIPYLLRNLVHLKDVLSIIVPFWYFIIWFLFDNTILNNF